MRTRIELDRADIIGILADHFEVDPKDVEIVFTNVITNVTAGEVTMEPDVIVKIDTTARRWGR